MEQQHTTASRDSSSNANGDMEDGGSALRSRINHRSSMGFRASSSAFIPCPMNV